LGEEYPLIAECLGIYLPCFAYHQLGHIVQHKTAEFFMAIVMIFSKA
jgi:hypothetical protein